MGRTRTAEALGTLALTSGDVNAMFSTEADP